ncbi:helix-turn-helix domain-containing protein [Fusibacter bizertensis]
MFDGEILKKLRMNNNLNQSELAKILDCSQKNISSYETNTSRPSFEVLVNIANYFDVSIDYLFKRVNSNLNSLSENEEFIINLYRSFDETEQIDFISFIKFIKNIKNK